MFWIINKNILNCQKKTLYTPLIIIICIQVWNIGTLVLPQIAFICTHFSWFVLIHAKFTFICIGIFTKKIDLITIPESYKIIPIGDFWMLVIFNDLKCKCEKVKWIYQRKIPKLNKCDKKRSNEWWYISLVRILMCL